MKKAGSIFEQLTSEHEIVNGLIEKLASCAPEERTSILEDIEENLVPHARAEEKTLYAALAQADGGNEADASLIDEAYEEHSEVDALLSDMMDLSADDAVWEEKIAALHDSIRHHVKVEETELFSKAKSMFSTEELEGLHEAYLTEKAEFQESLPSQDQINAKEISSAAASAIHQ